MPQFSAAVCYSFNSSSIHSHVCVCKQSSMCAQFSAQICTNIQALSMFLWVYGEVILLLLFIIFGLISSFLSLFPVKHKSLLFKIILRIHLSWLSEEPISVLRLQTQRSALSLQSLAPLPFLLVFSLTDYLSTSFALWLIRCVMALSLCTERSIS